MGFGFAQLFNLFKMKSLKILAGLVITLFLCFEFTHYIESYYIHAPQRYPLSWEYGFSDMVKKLNQYENNFNKVVITDRYDQPYILVLFYKQYDPQKYQPQAVLSPRDKFNFGTIRGFDKYEFKKVTSEEIKQNKDTLYIVTPEEAGDNIVIDRVNFPNGEPAFLFVRS
jgi:hypothetical protein